MGEVILGICLALFGMSIFLDKTAPALVIIIFMVLFLLPGLWLIWDGNETMKWKAEKKRKKDENEKMPPVDITAAEILSNTIRAKSLYKDRRLNVTGTITKISGGSSVLLGAGITLDDDFYCDFAWRGAVESVSMGQKVTIEGVLRFSDFGGCFLESCYVSPVNSSPQSYSASPRTVTAKPPSPKKTAKSSAHGSTNPVYSITAAEILSNIDRAKGLYNDRHLSVTGTIAKISHKNSQVILNGINGLICRFALPVMLNGLSTGQFVTIGGVFRNGCMEQCYVSPVNSSPQSYSSSPQTSPAKQTELQKPSTPSIDAMLNAAHSGDAKAQYDLSAAYLEGKIVPADIMKSIEWLKKSADNNYPEAMFELAIMYFQGLASDTTGVIVEKDDEKGISFMKRAAEKGFLPAAMFLDNLNHSVESLTRMADNGDVDAQCKLGFLYCEGKEVKQDIDKSIHYFRMAARQNNEMARMTVNMYDKFGPELWVRVLMTHLRMSRGDKVSADSHQLSKEEYDSIRSKAESGDAEAQYQLGIYCIDVLGDVHEAVKWLYKANAQKHPKANEAFNECFALNPGLTSWFMCNPDVKNW